MLQQGTGRQAFCGQTSSLRAKAFSSGVSRGSLQVGHRNVWCGESWAHYSSVLIESGLQVHNAITRQKKEAIVKELQTKLENSVIVFGLRYKNLDVSRHKTAYR